MNHLLIHCTPVQAVIAITKLCDSVGPSHLSVKGLIIAETGLVISRL